MAEKAEERFMGLVYGIVFLQKEHLKVSCCLASVWIAFACTLKNVILGQQKESSEAS